MTNISYTNHSISARCEYSVVVPTYCERENLPLLTERIAAAVSPLGKNYEIIIVDDDSQDGTEETIADLAGKGYPISLILRKDQRGLSSAVLRGFREAQGDMLICMDADLSHPPEAIPELIRSFDDPDIEFVLGSRYVSGASTDSQWGWFRWLNSKVATLLARPFTRAKDPMSGFFAIPREVFAKADTLDPIGYKIALELIVKCRCKNIREIPIHFCDRQFGQSKLNLTEQLRYLKHLKRLSDYKFGRISQLAQFCIVGATGMVVDLMIFYLLLLSSIPLMIARALAIWIAMTWNFALNRRLAFSYSRRGNFLAQYGKFAVSCSLGAVISWLICILLARTITFFADQIFLAAIIGIIAGTLVNFSVSCVWVFGKK